MRRNSHAAAPGAALTGFADIVGAAYARPGTADDAIDGVVPACVVRPRDAAEVQACVAAAEAADLGVVASGLGAHLDVGAPPRSLDVLLRLDRLARVVDHQAGDMTVTVEAGCPLPALAATLAAAGQWLPLDPPTWERTTVGGLLAANLSGPLRASQGTARDLLLGIRVVGAGGALIAGGGRVVKNVAGYDLPKLHVGALGTLGVIVEATLKVRPQPAAEEALVIACRTPGEAADLAAAVLDGDAEPLWIETCGGAAADGATLAVGVAGIPAEVAHARAVVTGLAAPRDVRSVEDAAALRRRLVELLPAAAVLRAAMLPRDAGAVVERVVEEAHVAGTAVRWAVHAANGIVRAAVHDGETVAALVRALRPLLEERGGSLVVERATADVKHGLDVFGAVGPGLALMRGVKGALDPRGVFAVGRFAGGI